MTQDQLKVLLEVKQLLELNELTYSKFTQKNDWDLSALTVEEVVFIRQGIWPELRKKLEYLGKENIQ